MRLSSLCSAFLLFIHPIKCILYDKPYLRNSEGHLILESRAGKNVTLKGGYVNINGVDISRSFSLIQRVEPQLMTLASAPLDFLLSNLTSVVQSLSSETRLAQKLDSIAANSSYTTGQIKSMKTEFILMQQNITSLSRNLSQLSTNALSEDKLNILRNLTEMQNNAANSGDSLSSNDLRRMNNKLTTLESQTVKIPDLEERLTAIEIVLNDTTSSSGSNTSAGTNRRITRIERKVDVLRRRVQGMRRRLYRNNCGSNPCLHGGTCISTTTFTGYQCLCPTGWEGQSCNQDVNECIEFVGTDIGCQNGATCTNTAGSYTCICSSGWFGIHCTTKEDSCNSNSNTEICGHGTCIPSARGAHPYSCICDKGFKASPLSPACIQDIDECTSQNPPCSKDPQVSCINTYGSFRCGHCPPGYEGNGLYCRDINECEVNNGGCSIYPRVECINTRPFRRCGPCPPGYSGDGIRCVNIGSPCQMNPCHPLAVCQDNAAMSSTYYTCTCQVGYTGNGMGPTGCTQIGGSNTGQSNPCVPNPCIHGTCSSHLNQYTCYCQPGYTGTVCDVVLNPCSSSPCLNGGTCWPTSGTFSCLCPSSHTGTLCQFQTDQCGGIISGMSGVLSYPEGNLQPYEHDVSCAWVIRVNETMVVNVTFTHFRLEHDADCSYDWLEVRDGPGTGSRLLDKSCGNVAPGINGTLYSTHNSLYLRFRSDQTYSNDGFTLTWNATRPVCGGDLNERNHGTINSPGYPDNYPINRDCYWSVQVSQGKKIQFSFAALGLETHPNCSFDKLVIYDGLRETSPIISSYCTSEDVPPPIVSSGSEALVYFHSDSLITGTGFHITYSSQPGIPGCGGILTREEGQFSVPTMRGLYHHNMVCEWLIRVHPDERVQLTFTDFRLEHHSTCGYDVVEVRDGRNIESPLLGRFCSDAQPEPLISSGNRMFVYFRSDSSLAYEGFTANYKIECGGTYGGSTGRIHSPYHPDSYPHGRICDYVIRQPIGNAIVLNFTSFDIEGPNGTCPFDYLEVRDGSSSTSPFIGRFCGAEGHRPSPIISTLNAIWIRFKTDGSVSNRGFVANYTTIETRCGGIYHNLIGTISSPNSPAQYLGNHDCTWVIDVPSDYVIQLTWLFFTLEHQSTCSYDYVEVYDNSTVPGTGGLIGGKRYCGSTMPPVMTSLTNIMTIKFHSDSAVNHDGFSLTYHSLHSSRFCGGNYHTSSGMIISPLYPNGYPNSRTCTWKITVPHNNQIRITFDTVDIEAGRSCRFDFLEIRNGGYETAPVLAKICGRNKTVDPIFSHSHQLYLKFVTDSSKNYKGFRLYWSQTATGCGGTLTSVTGEFMTPGYPQPYHRRAECFWTIRINKGSKVRLTFVDFKLKNSRGCTRDYMEVRDGPNPDSPLIGKYCSTQHFLSINSSGNSLWIKFKGGWYLGERGFRAIYMSDCNVELSEPMGVIESPNFPNNYPHVRNCTWTIKAPLGNSINASFSHFDVEDPASIQSTVCEYDFVEIRVGKSSESARTTKGHFCGEHTPLLIYSGSKMNMMDVQFKSDYLVSRNGFRMEYVVSGCGGVLTSQTGTFSSPNYPNAYPTETTCEWHIEVMTSYKIKITIHEFDIESSMTGDKCMFDSLNVYGGKDKTSPLLVHLCHHQNKPVVVETQGRYAFVSIISDYSVRGRGFTASYEAVEGGCGGTFVGHRGIIHSPNYPANYDHNSDCIWNLQVDSNHVVQLNFSDFAVEPHHNCSYDYVRVFDGDSIDSPLLLSHCGSTLPVPPIIRSSANEMTVRLKADSIQSSRGFKAVYREGCGATLSATLDARGNYISSPNFPQLMSAQQNCTWHIKAEEGYKVRLIFTHLNMERIKFATPTVNGSINCEVDFVSVLNGIDLMSPVIGKYCGSHIPLPIVSTGRYLTIHMQNALGDGVGFRSMYSALDSICGGQLWSTSGSIASPNYPDSYPQSYECIWYINAGLGNRIRLSFSVFNIEESNHCNRDYIEVHQGSAAGPLLLHNCSNIFPSDVTADNGMWIKFKSDDEGTSDGFLASFTLLPGNVIYKDRGIIMSPLYPQLFLQRGEFTYKIIVSQGFYIQITIYNIAIEVNPVTNVCHSSLVIHDGPNALAPVMKTICGYQAQRQAITTSTNIVFIKFNSNFAHEGSSFRLKYQAVSDSAAIDNIGESGFDKNCSFRVKLNDTVNIQSPGYPENYANNLRCEWIIETNSSFVIRLYTFLRLEESENCIFDKIEIYDGIDGTTNWNKTDTLCKRSDSYKFFKSTGRFMRIVFITDVSATASGFNLHLYRSCGGIMTEPNGVIDTIGERYSRHSRCDYRIKVRQGRTISLAFTAFRIPNDTITCSRHYLLTYNGPSDVSPYLGIGRYCGTSIPTLPESSSNEVFLRYRNRQHFSSKGFRLKYREVSAACGGEYHLKHVSGSVSAVEFSSPNYPNPPHPHTECSWVITATQGKAINLNFIEHFDIQSQNDYSCRKAYVEVRDGGTMLSPLIGKYCGVKKPNTLVSTDNSIYVRYYTNAATAHVGFKAKATLGICGGTYRLRSGLLISPNYPNSYDANLNCSWHIIAPSGHHVILNFPEVSVYNEDPTCSSGPDRIVVNDTKINNVSTVICGINQEVEPFESASNQVTVNFTSGELQPGADVKFRISANTSVEECGGTFFGEGGVITSPGYPHGVATAWYCYYDLIGPIGTRIKVEFEDLDLASEETNYCSGYISIRNGLNFRISPYINAPSCKTVDPEPVRSSMNEMRIIYNSRPSTSKGMKIRWNSDEPQECGGVVTNDNGILHSPGFQNGTYNHSLYCVWNIQNPNPSNSSINVTILFLHTEGCYDYLLIESLLPSGVPIDKKKICHGESQLNYIIPYPTARISFITDSSINKTGFNLTYSMTNCGGYLVGPESVFTSPNYPQNYPPNCKCAWIMKFPYDSQIELNFTDFKLENSMNHDFIRILNGPEEDSPAEGQYTGQTVSNIISASNSLRVIFQSDATTSEKGFRALASIHTRGCGGIYHSNYGSISSPGFNTGTGYSTNTECRWEIRIKPGYFITTKFVQQFDLETSPNCQNDFVQLSITTNTTGENAVVSTPKFCGKQIPDPINSTSQLVQILFRSNSEINGRGFKLQWIGRCGGYYTEKEGFIMSPNYPLPYPNYAVCDYRIAAEPGSFVTLNFTHMQIPGGWQNRCSYGKIVIKENYMGRYWTNRTICGIELPEPILLRGNSIIKFYSRYNYRKNTGFMLKYKREDCGGNITEPMDITIPGGWNGYSNSMECQWDIIAPLGKVIILKFQSLSLEHHINCDFDHLSVYKSLSSSDDQLINRFCGIHSDPLPVLNTNTSRARVIFSSDVYVTAGGFKATVQFTYGCGGSKILSNAGDSETIRSPDADGDGDYEPYLACTWFFVGNENMVLLINFTRLEIEGRNITANDTLPCPYDYVQIYDGPSKLSPLLATLCGSTVPTRAIIGTRNSFVITFISDSMNEMSGFTATIKNEPRICGGALTASDESQSLQSPGYSQGYPILTRCFWLISAPVNNQSIHMEINDFNLEDSPKCMKDWVYFHEGPDDSIINTGSERKMFPPYNFNGKLAYFSSIHSVDHFYCGTETPHSINSKGHDIGVYFNSDQSVTSSGFRLHYSVLNCNRTYNGYNGLIIGVNHEDCYITISAPEGTFVNLYFLRFSFGSQSTYTFKIFDGPSATSDVLTDYSGHVGRQPSPVYGTGSSMFLHISPPSGWFKYYINFATSDKPNGCGGRFFGKYFLLTSPSYPHETASNQSCIYTLTVPNPFHAAIKFMYWDFTTNANCSSTYLELVKILPSGESATPSTYCGEDDTPAITVSPSNRLVINFQIGVEGMNGTGWSAIVASITPHQDTNFDIDEMTENS